MFFRSNTRYAQAPASSWTPADISAEDGALVAWWKADAGCFDAQTGGSACDSGDIIYRWEDQSGRGMHLQTTTSGIGDARKPHWLSPPYGLPFVRWNSYWATGGPTQLRKQMGAYMYRDDCDFLNGKPGCSIITVMRIKPVSVGQNFGTLNVLHGAPALGQDYDKLSRIRADFSFRGPTTDTGGGVFTMYQSRRYVWMKLTPANDSVPSPYAYTQSPNSFNVTTRGSHSDQHDRRCWFIHGSGFDCATGYALHLHNARLIYSAVLASGGLNGGAYPNVNSNRVLMNDGHWADYGHSLAAPIDIGEQIVIDRVPNTRLRLLIEGYLAHRWGISNSLYEVMTGASTPDAAGRKRRTLFHPFGGRPGALTIPKDPAWTPDRKIASTRGVYDADFSGRRWTGGPTTHHLMIHDLAGYGDAVQGNWYQGVLYGTGRSISGRSTLSVRQTIDGVAATASNLDIPTNAINHLRGASGVTVAAVLKPVSTSGTHTWFEWRDNTASGYGVRCGWDNNGSLKMYSARWINATDSSTTHGSTALSTSFAYLCIWRFDLTNGTRQLWLNGVLDGETTGLATGTFASSGGDATGAVFNNIGNNTGSASGDAAELCWFNEALSTSDRQKVEGYLAWKWGLDSYLPKSHPYGSGPPT